MSLVMMCVGTDTIATEFRLIGTAAPKMAASITAHYAEVLRMSIMSHASGRPGPNVITGEYRSSWTIDFTYDEGGLAAVVGTDEPYGRRLEFGFAGADATGRIFNQPPYPHVWPAADEVEPDFVAALAAGIL